MIRLRTIGLIAAGLLTFIHIRMTESLRTGVNEHDDDLDDVAEVLEQFGEKIGGRDQKLIELRTVLKAQVAASQKADEAASQIAVYVDDLQIQIDGLGGRLRLLEAKLLDRGGPVPPSPAEAKPVVLFEGDAVPAGPPLSEADLYTGLPVDGTELTFDQARAARVEAAKRLPHV